MNLDDPEDRIVAAAEFVLGLLEPAERDAFEAALKRDAGLRAEVGRWQDELLGLSDRIPAVAPSDAVWRRIDAEIAREPARPAVGSTRPATVPRPAPRTARPGFWMAIAGFATAMAVVLATLLALERRELPATWVAVLEAPDRQARWVVQVADRGPLRLVAIGDPGPVPEGRVWQFWTKPKDASGPTSLGLVPVGGSVTVPRDRVPGPFDDSLFEITLEPAGGSTIGRPTGPVLFIGRATRVASGT